jgi:tetratricopeptide (TPR) repeat protein
LVLKGEELNSEVVHRLIVCYLNIAICNLKLEEWREAGSACDEVLKLDPDNAKAKYRKAVALSSSPASGLEGLREAIKLLREAVQFDPSNALIKAKLSELIDQLKKLEAKSKEVCKTIFSQRTYEDVPAAASEPVPRNRLKEIANFIERGEHTARALEAEGNDVGAEKVRATMSNIQQARDELEKQLEALKMMKQAQGAALGDVLMAGEVERLRAEHQSLLPQVPKATGSKRWDWMYRPLLALVSACTLVAYWLEKTSK